MNEEIMKKKLAKVRKYLIENEDEIWQYDPSDYEDQLVECDRCFDRRICVKDDYCQFAEEQYLKDRNGDIEEFFRDVLWNNEEPERWAKHCDYLNEMAKSIKAFDYWDQELCDKFLKEAGMETLNKCHIEILCPVIEELFNVSLY